MEVKPTQRTISSSFYDLIKNILLKFQSPKKIKICFLIKIKHGDMIKAMLIYCVLHIIVDLSFSIF